jgi:hypothetical protein
MNQRFVVLWFLAVVFSGCTQNGIAPSRTESRITKLVASLGWDCVREECHYYWSVDADGAVVDELKRLGKPATPELISALADPKRAVPANLVLWHIWSPTSEEFPFEIYSSQLPFRYRTGKLHWTSSTREQFDIPSEMLKDNQNWWRNYASARGH